MRIISKIIFSLIIIVLILFVGANFIIHVYAKPLLCEKLSEFLDRSVSIASIRIMPPCSISVKNLEITDILNVEAIQLEPSILSFIFSSGGLSTLRIDKPYLTIVRNNDASFNIQEIITSVETKRPQSDERKKKRVFIVKEAIINKGSILFKDDRAVSSFSIEPFDCSVITSLRDFKTRLNISASIVSEQGKHMGELTTQGWLNFLKKDMDMVVSLEKIDVVSLSAYIKNSFKKITSGFASVRADMLSENNDLTINCHLETHELRFSDKSFLIDTERGEIALLGSLSDFAFDSLIGPGGNGVFDFSIHTKFDRPRLEGLQFKGNIFVAPLKRIITDAPKEAMKKIGNDFKAIGEGLKDQIKDALGGGIPEDSSSEGTPSDPVVEQEEKRTIEDIEDDFKAIGKELEKQFKGLAEQFTSSTSNDDTSTP